MRDAIRWCWTGPRTSSSSGKRRTGTSCCALVAQVEPGLRLARRPAARPRRARLPGGACGAASARPRRDALGGRRPPGDRVGVPARRARLHPQDGEPVRLARRDPPDRRRDRDPPAALAVPQDGSARQVPSCPRRKRPSSPSSRRAARTRRSRRRLWLERADRQVPPAQHLPQARHHEPDRGAPVRVRARSRARPRSCEQAS